MTPLAKRILISATQGAALLVLSYFVDEYFIYRDIPLAGTLLNNLAIGAFGGILAFVWATRISEKESAIRRVEEEKHAAVVEERNRLAREIHDTCAQGFTGITLQLEAAEEILMQNSNGVLDHIVSARMLARESLNGLRESVWKLRPDALKGTSLPEAIEALAKKVLCGVPIDMRVSLRGTVKALHSEIEANLLHISQEAITNAIKHAKARKVRVELAYEPCQVQLCVKDDGIGFIPDSHGPQSGFGLTSMRERARSVGGEWSICSSPGQGTQIQVVVPVQAQDRGTRERKYETA